MNANLRTAMCLNAVLVLFSSACHKSMAPTSPTSTADRSLTRKAVATTVCDYDLAESTLSAQGWTRVFAEPFDASLAQWTTWYGGAYNNELQLYQAPNLVLANGVLTIEARAENVTGPTLPGATTTSSYAYTSGRIESKTHFGSSRTTPKVRIAARMKLPRGYGMWPAFWSYGDPWPTQGEIDIVEARGQETDRYQTAYWFGRRSGINVATNTEGFVVANADLASCWHTYECIWEKNTLTFLLDGQVVDVKTGGYISDMYGKKQRITLNLAVGGLFFSNLNINNIVTGSFAIDWVKVFTAK